MFAFQPFYFYANKNKILDKNKNSKAFLEFKVGCS